MIDDHLNLCLGGMMGSSEASLKKFDVRSDQDWARKRRPDEWDSNYDRGKTKKVKNNDFAGRRPEGIGAKLQKAYESKHLRSKK